MKIHREGIVIILFVLLLITSLNLVIYWFVNSTFIQSLLIIVSTVFFLLVVWFFRSPVRNVIPEETVILCPADGKVVVIEEVIEKEYFKDKRIQVSVFMSPLNVHVNRYPISGTVSYYKYHPGKYLVAWHPKSSELNERSTVLIRDDQGREILTRQIAGAVARRIVTYAVEGEQVIQGGELGFIKFGSRVDLFLPPDTKILVKVGDKVSGNRTVIGKF
ncbi:MAG TPA: phosphatidylserine decarboxylase family protein [Bacteroidales bacterium]|nr:phosphatidylserine decarboxylase family protein [Bacteroidales bacterium]